MPIFYGLYANGKEIIPQQIEGALKGTTKDPLEWSPAEDKAWYDRKVLLHETASFTGSKVHILRLQPGEDLRDSLCKYARFNEIKAATILSCVGSLTDTNIRYANDENGTSLTGHFEIVSLVGMIDFQQIHHKNYSGDGHVHISVSDEKGVTIGGHLLSGNRIYTTAEISLLEIDQALFRREPDLGPNGSGYKELKVYPLPDDSQSDEDATV
eukprot:gene7978-8799_t